jgi:ankyrin repeat protein
MLPANLSVLKDLVAKGIIDIECKIRGLSLLAYSAAMGNQQALSMLIEMGADLSFRDEQGRSVLFHALASGSDESVQIIESSLTQLVPDVRNCDELMYGAVIGGNVRWVKKLIDMSCDVDVRLANDATLLMLLPSSTHPKALQVTEVLLESGLDPHAKDDDGRTALDIARLQGNSEFISLVEEYISSSK